MLERDSTRELKGRSVPMISSRQQCAGQHTAIENLPARSVLCMAWHACEAALQGVGKRLPHQHALGCMIPACTLRIVNVPLDARS